MGVEEIRQRPYQIQQPNPPIPSSMSDGEIHDWLKGFSPIYQKDVRTLRYGILVTDLMDYAFSDPGFYSDVERKMWVYTVFTRALDILLPNVADERQKGVLLASAADLIEAARAFSHQIPYSNAQPLIGNPDVILNVLRAAYLHRLVTDFDGPLRNSNITSLIVAIMNLTSGIQGLTRYDVIDIQANLAEAVIAQVHPDNRDLLIVLIHPTIATLNSAKNRPHPY